MKTYSAVATEEKAREILTDWLNENCPYVPHTSCSWIEKTTVNCECGQTQALKASWGDEDAELAIVAFCDRCGDDSAFIDEVLEVI